MNNNARHSTVNVPTGYNVQHFPFNKLRPFRNHAFKLYKGDKFDRMVQSVRDNGIIQPIIVRPTKSSDKFEIVSGHNRVEAAKAAGLTEIPAVVRELSDDEAMILANVTNITQRTFKDWLPSEKANSFFQHHEAIKRQGSRSGLAGDTSGDNRQKSDGYARDKTARVYGVKECTVRLYLELYRLIDELKDRLDDESDSFGVTAAQSISHISKDGQALVNAVLTEEKGVCGITVDNAKEVRKALKNYTVVGMSDEQKAAVKDEIRNILTLTTPAPKAPKSVFETVVFLKTQYDLLFSSMDAEEVIEEIIEAIEYFRKRNILPEIIRDNEQPATEIIQQPENNRGSNLIPNTKG